MLKVYPAIFHNEDNVYWVEFPDLPGCQTCGDSLEQTMELAVEAMGLYLVALLESGKALPQPTAYSAVDPHDGFVSFVSVDPNRYRRNTRAVKKTLSIPAWLAEEAESHHLSLSKVLQEALQQKLELQ